METSEEVVHLNKTHGLSGTEEPEDASEYSEGGSSTSLEDSSMSETDDSSGTTTPPPGALGPEEAGEAGAHDQSRQEPPPQPEVAMVFTQQESILIFDWDDTVLPSTWITKQGLRLDDDCILTEEQTEVLNGMATHAESTLREAMRHGKVVLVTNAEAGWIELSCKKFFPTLCELLEGFRILSARSAFENAEVTSPFEWKYRAFEQEILHYYEKCDPESKKNIISFGDSAHEREAIIRVTSGMTNCRTKSLKFAERPEIDQLLKEHKLISGCFQQIVHHDGNLDLCIRCS